MDLDLKGKVAVVTGGARGLGRAIVEGLLREGANVAVADIRFDELGQVIGAHSPNRIMTVRTDVSKKADADNMAHKVIGKYRVINILVNAAAVIQDTRFIDIEEEEWDRILDVNLKGIYLITHAVLPYMVERKEGKIVNISSRSGKDAQPGLSHYGASKFGILGLTQALAKELAELNINVNAVCPGVIRTEMWEKLLEIRSLREGKQKSEIFEKVIESIPLRRAQTPEDIANVVLFLSSEAARNITGEAVNINGGVRMD